MNGSQDPLTLSHILIELPRSGELRTTGDKTMTPKMALRPINPPLREGQHLLCCRCNKWTATHADLNGEPFRAYYCPACMAMLEPE